MNHESSSVTTELDRYPLSVKETKEWLGNLPKTDSEKCIDIMLSGLRTLAESKLDIAKRLKILNCYHAPVSFAIGEVRNHRAILSLPLSQKALSNTAKIAQIYGLLADQYLQLAAPIVVYKGFSELPSKRQLASACYWGICYLSGILINSYESYQRRPAGLWANMHRLYMLARGNNVLENKRVNGGTRTIAQLYKSALLLSLSDPYQLPLGIVDHLFELLDTWSASVHLRESCQTTDGKCLFVIDLHCDDPGLPYFAHTKIDSSGGTIFLNTVPLVERLNVDLTQVLIEAAKEPSDLARSSKLEHMEMLRTLIVHWGTHPIRQLERKKIHQKCDLVVGLKSVNFVVNNRKPYFEEQMFANFDATNEMMRGTFGYQQHRQKDDYICYHHWRYMDESRLGIHLILEDTASVQVEVGDFVAVKSEQDQERWQPGIVRWAMSREGADLELGIYKVGTDVKAAAVKRICSDEALNQELYTPALVLTGLQQTKQCHSVVAKSGIYEPNGMLWLNIQGEDHVVQASNLIKSTRSVDWFEFTYEYERSGIVHPSMG
ncbi:hypothetical protein ACFL17_08285 [Pseudomonadota bacterium]